MKDFNYIFQANSRTDLQKLLNQWASYLIQCPLSNRVKWSIDVDPIEF